jgi:tetratricopeptide (TPR) repeat protein
MKDLISKFGRREPGKVGAAGAAPALNVGAFGKHPGWDDHIPGIGLETEDLAAAKQILYVRGIGAQVDSGAWEQMPPEQRLPGFDHSFLWLRPRAVLAGVLWSSVDRKGRAKYPMVLCAEGQGVPAEAMLREVLPELDSLRLVCQAANTAEAVTQACGQSQETLRTRLSSLAGASVEIDTGLRHGFVGHRSFGEDSVGLHRVLYELQQMGKTHVRVPCATDSWREAILLWSEFVLRAVPQAPGLTIIHRHDTDWLDVIAGDPSAESLKSLQDSLAVDPLTTEIPYNLDEAFAARCTRFIGSFITGAPIETAPETPAPTPGPSPGSGSRSEGGAFWKRFLIPVIAVLLLLLGAGILISSLGKKSAKPPAERATPGAPTTSAAPETAAPTEPAPVTPASEYTKAMAAALAAQQRGDFSNALTQVALALVAKPGDAEGVQLRDRLQQSIVERMQASLRQQMQATKEAEADKLLEAAKTMLAAGDFSNALRQVEALLQQRPADAQALQLSQTIQQRLNSEAAFKRNLDTARTALAGADLKSADSALQGALAIKPGNPEVTALQAQLKTAQAAAAEKQAAAAAAAKAAATPVATAPGGARRFFTNSLGMEFVFIPGLVGGKDAWLGVHEVTQRQFSQVMKTNLSKQYKAEDDLPVANIPQSAAVAFAALLSNPSEKYQLPSRQDWLVAAGATQLTPDEQRTNAWNYLEQKGLLGAEVTRLSPGAADLQSPQRVGSRGPQSTGLCDLWGNVREWLSPESGAFSAGYAFNDEAMGASKPLFRKDAPDMATGFRVLLLKSE